MATETSFVRMKSNVLYNNSNNIVREKCEPYSTATRYDTYSLNKPKQYNYNYCRFSLINGDNNRKGGTKAQTFDF